MKKFLIASGAIFALVLLAILTWTTLYLTIPNIKKDTDNLFNWNQIEVPEDKPNEEMPTALIINIGG